MYHLDSHFHFVLGADEYLLSVLLKFLKDVFMIYLPLQFTFHCRVSHGV